MASVLRSTKRWRQVADSRRFATCSPTSRPRSTGGQTCFSKRYGPRTPETWAHRAASRTIQYRDWVGGRLAAGKDQLMIPMLGIPDVVALDGNDGKQATHLCPDKL